MVVAEKPSAAKSIADVLGAKTRRDGYYEGNGHIVSWCVGHLLGLAEPSQYNEKYEKWRLEDLPISPENWKYVPAESVKKQLAIICALMKRGDVECVVNGADAGREGELIFRLVYEHAKGKTVIKNGWKSIQQAFMQNVGKTKKETENSLPEIIEGQKFTAHSNVREGFTQPPKTLQRGFVALCYGNGGHC